MQRSWLLVPVCIPFHMNVKWIHNPVDWEWLNFIFTPTTRTRTKNQNHPKSKLKLTKVQNSFDNQPSLISTRERNFGFVFGFEFRCYAVMYLYIAKSILHITYTIHMYVIICYMQGRRKHDHTCENGNWASCV
jgi:hypothetical protein